MMMMMMMMISSQSRQFLPWGESSAGCCETTWKSQVHALPWSRSRRTGWIQPICAGIHCRVRQYGQAVSQHNAPICQPSGLHLFYHLGIPPQAVSCYRSTEGQCAHPRSRTTDGQRPVQTTTGRSLWSPIPYSYPSGGRRLGLRCWWPLISFLSLVILLLPSQTLITGLCRNIRSRCLGHFPLSYPISILLRLCVQ